tara:strand:- start:12790 stop:15447 length:2658 start_codon:yes stop_codon:yes gene_type:complete
MASYKDIIPTFNPYIQQEPVEAMMKVGVYKQERYDEGIKKIQESIDNIAGLDVVRDVDKQYLQSKLNQLGGKLSTVAGGDFSNFQLVNSVNGMTNQIVKDPKVLSAVGSAARYRKALEGKEKIIQDGKGSDSNTFMFNRDADEWLNSTDINSEYNGMYRPYTDYNEKAREIVKALGSKETGYDVAFNEKGQLVDAITRVRIKGISSERIRTALKQGLNPDEYKQIQTDGVYKYSNTSPEQYVNDINSSYENTFNKYVTEIDRLSTLQNSASSPGEKQKLQKQIDDINNASESLKSEYESVSKGFEGGNVEGSQAQLYTMNWIEDTSNAYATESQIRSYHTNPMADMRLKRDKAKAEARSRAARLKETKRGNDIEQAKLNFMKDPYGPVPLPTDEASTSSVEIIARVEANRSKTENSLAQKQNNFVNKYKVDGAPMSQETFDQLVDKYKRKPNSVSWDQRIALDDYIKTDRDLAVQGNLIEQANGEADFIYDTQLNDSLKEVMGVDNVNGYSPAEAVLKFREFTKRYFISGSPGSTSPTTGISSGGTASRLDNSAALADFQSNKISQNEFDLYKLWAASGGDRNFKDDYSGETKSFINKLRVAGGQAAQTAQEEKDNYVTKYYKENYLLGQSQAYRIPLGSAKEIDAFRPVLSSLAEVADRMDGGLPNYDGDSATIRDIAADLQTAMVYTNSDGEYQINISDKEGTNTTIPINEEIYSSIFGGRFEASPEVAMFDEMYLPKMLSTPTPLYRTTDDSGTEVLAKQPQSFYSTSLDGEYVTTPDNSFLSGPTDFPNVNYYTVSGNVVSDGNPKNTDKQFKLQLNVYDPIVDELVLKNFLLPAIMDKASLVPTLQQITDEAIWQLLNSTSKNMPNSILQQLEESSKEIE